VAAEAGKQRDLNGGGGRRGEVNGKIQPGLGLVGLNRLNGCASWALSGNAVR